MIRCKTHRGRYYAQCGACPWCLLEKVKEQADRIKGLENDAFLLRGKIVLNECQMGADAKSLEEQAERIKNMVPVEAFQVFCAKLVDSNQVDEEEIPILWKEAKAAANEEAEEQEEGNDNA